jgi:predicted acetyltransferase
MSTFWFMQGPTMVGESRIRHELPPELADAGHIGCAVRPGARGAGIGTRILAMTLEQASVVGHSSVSLTCDSDNAASARMIAKNGGLLISSATSDNTGKERNRYVVQLRKRGV